MSKIYTFVPRAGAYAFAKQESIVFDSIRSLGSGTLEEIAYECDARGLKTRQSSERIVAYYMVSLKKHGLVEVSGGNATRRVTRVIDEESEDEADVG